VPKRRMSDIMRERHRFSQVFIEPKRSSDGARNLDNFQRMREPRSVMIALMRHENLRFLLQTAKSRGMDNSVAIALKRRPGRGLWLINEPSAGVFPAGRVNCPLFRNVRGHYLIGHEQCHFV